MSPKGHVHKVWSPVALLGGGRTFKTADGAGRRQLGHLGYAFGGDMETQALPASLLPGCREVSSSTTHSHQHPASPQAQKSQSNQPWAKTSKTNIFSLKIDCASNFHSDAKLTNIRAKISFCFCSCSIVLVTAFKVLNHLGSYIKICTMIHLFSLLILKGDASNLGSHL